MTTHQRFTNDGFGINGPDEYRTRVATFAKGAGAEFVPELAARFAAFDELVAALRELAEFACPKLDAQNPLRRKVDTALSKVTP